MYVVCLDGRINGQSERQTGGRIDGWVEKRKEKCRGRNVFRKWWVLCGTVPEGL